MSSALYNRDILRLATSLPAPLRLDDAQGSADRRSPTCGSRVIADVRMNAESRVDQVALTVSACALGQASAALMYAHVGGCSVEELQTATDSLRHYLAHPDADSAADFWPGIDVFAAARDYPARHPSIMLAFEAVTEAVQRALSDTTQQQARAS
ncbi:MAG: iron-sulfur cluster assembly scaffold protein [Sphingobium sp.]